MSRLQLGAVASLFVTLVSSSHAQTMQSGGSATLAAGVASISQQTDARRVLDVLREFDLIAKNTLWPGFMPAETPVEVYDGKNTYLYHHPKPPDGFRPLDGVPGLFVYQGRHKGVSANTSAEVEGVLTATADISGSVRPSARELAALLVHESFHVYVNRTHPRWAANEVSLFTYPVDNVEVLSGRRLETMALVRAMQATDTEEARCWTNRALAERQQRYRKMSADAAAYERGTELNEGLAQYIEYLSIQKAPALQADDFPAERFRHRGYATGQAYANLLDRFAPGWKSQIGDTPLDVLLQNHMPEAGKTCSFSEKERSAQQVRARQDVEQVVLGRKQRRQNFLETSGWTVQIVAGKEPLWPQMFDPWNVAVIDNKEVLHSSVLKLENNSGALEVHKHVSLTEAAGQHPLFTGVSRVTVKGLERPQVAEAEGKVTIKVDGAEATFTGSVEQSGQLIVVNVR